MDSANRPGIKAATLIVGDDENSFRLPNKGKHGVSLGPRGRPKGSHVLSNPGNRSWGRFGSLFSRKH